VAPRGGPTPEAATGLAHQGRGGSRRRELARAAERQAGAAPHCPLLGGDDERRHFSDTFFTGAGDVLTPGEWIDVIYDPADPSNFEPAGS
jgi:hypothetical protein